MKVVTEYIAITLFLLVAFSSCEKFSGDNDGITGSWRCREESGTNGGRAYSVTIDRAANGDTTLFIIYNFHNLGFETETYFQLRDTVATLLYSGDGSYSVAGKGYARKDYSSITWEYSVSGLNANDNYVHAYYFRK